MKHSSSADTNHMETRLVISMYIAGVQIEQQVVEVTIAESEQIAERRAERYTSRVPLLHCEPRERIGTRTPQLPVRIYDDMLHFHCTRTSTLYNRHQKIVDRIR